jgi:hypothetical protein
MTEYFKTYIVYKVEDLNRRDPPHFHKMSYIVDGVYTIAKNKSVTAALKEGLL